MKLSQLSVGDYVWFRWYDRSLLAGLIETSYQDGIDAPRYRVRSKDTYYNGVTGMMIDRKMEANEIMQYKLLGSFL